jgi:hypothetical protein
MFRSYFESLAHSLSHENFTKTISSNIYGVNSELKDIQEGLHLNQMQNILKDKISKVDHPYFKNLISQRLEDFINHNQSLFIETNETSPLNPDTFGAIGLKYTKESLLCVSSIDDYWNDMGDTDYLKFQKELTDNGVIIKRLFVVNDKNKESAFQEMKKQKQYGVEVRSIENRLFGESDFFRDYLIQDKELLVDLTFISNEKTHLQAKEIITKQNVNERVREFRRYWASAKTH